MVKVGIRFEDEITIPCQCWFPDFLIILLWLYMSLKSLEVKRHFVCSFSSNISRKKCMCVSARVRACAHVWREQGWMIKRGRRWWIPGQSWKAERNSSYHVPHLLPSLKLFHDKLKKVIWTDERAKQEELRQSGDLWSSTHHESSLF